MIDVHCHLEQRNYDDDRDEFIAGLRKGLRAVVSNATHGDDLERGLTIKRKHEGFVFLAAGIHPQLIGDISAEAREAFFKKLLECKNEVVSVGEAGLDFYWVKEKELRELQKKYFQHDLLFAESIGKPVTVHSRDAAAETAAILVEQNAPRVHWHLFKDKPLVPHVVKHGWMISVGPLLLTSKTMAKIVREMPLEQIMLETDSPWWGAGERGTPMNIIPVAQRIAAIKKKPFEDVWAQCGRNAKEFFSL